MRNKGFYISVFLSGHGSKQKLAEKEYKANPPNNKIAASGFYVAAPPNHQYSVVVGNQSSQHAAVELFIDGEYVGGFAVELPINQEYTFDGFCEQKSTSFFTEQVFKFTKCRPGTDNSNQSQNIGKIEAIFYKVTESREKNLAPRPAALLSSSTNDMKGKLFHDTITEIGGSIKHEFCARGAFDKTNIRICTLTLWYTSQDKINSLFSLQPSSHSTIDLTDDTDGIEHIPNGSPAGNETDDPNNAKEKARMVQGRKGYEEEKKRREERQREEDMRKEGGTESEENAHIKEEDEHSKKDGADTVVNNQEESEVKKETEGMKEGNEEKRKRDKDRSPESNKKPRPDEVIDLTEEEEDHARKILEPSAVVYTPIINQVLSPEAQKLFDMQNFQVYGARIRPKFKTFMETLISTGEDPTKNLITIFTIGMEDKRRLLRGAKGAKAASFIPKGTIIGPYAGKVWECTEHEKEVTPFNKVAMNMYTFDFKFKIDNKRIMIDALEYGNATRFANDTVINIYKDYNTLDNHIGLPNVSTKEVVYNNWPYMLVFALEDIQEGQELLMRYQASYWKSIVEMMSIHKRFKGQI